MTKQETHFIVGRPQVPVSEHYMTETREKTRREEHRRARAKECVKRTRQMIPDRSLGDVLALHEPTIR